MKNYSPVWGIIELHGNHDWIKLRDIGSTYTHTGEHLYAIYLSHANKWIYQGMVATKAKTNKALFEDSMNFIHNYELGEN